MVDADGAERFNNMFQENFMLHTENKNLHMCVKALQKTVDDITAKNIVLLAERNTVMIANGDGKNKLLHFVSVWSWVKALLFTKRKYVWRLPSKAIRSKWLVD